MTRLAILAAAAVITAGCASAGASGPGSPDGAASVVPANAVAFVAASTDLDSSQWHSIAKPFLKQYASFKPALGGEVDIAVLPDKQVVAFTQPQDAKKLEALAQKYHAKTRAIGDWTAIAKTEAVLDSVASAKSFLAGNALYVAAMKRLPGDALVRAYANGATAEALVSSIPGQLETSRAPVRMRYRFGHKFDRFKTAATVGGTGYRWGAAAVTSTSDGLKLQAFARTGDVTAAGQPRYLIHTIAPYRSALVDEIPAGVLAAADFQVPGGTFENLPKLPPLFQKLFDPKLSSDLAPQLDTLLGGETAIYVRAALPMPEVTLVTQPLDTAAASRTLDDLISASVQKPPQLYRAVIGGQFVVSTTQKGIDDFRAGGAKLSADPSFVAAAKQSGLPEETTGFVYANLKDALPLLALAGVKVPAGLPDMRSFIAYGGQSPTESTFTAFVGVG